MIDLFRYPSVAELARYVREGAPGALEGGPLRERARSRRERLRRQREQRRT